MRTGRWTWLWMGLGLVTLLAACRGQVSESPPFHVNPNMDDQERYDPQEANPMFADGRAQRTPPVGTVAVEGLKDDTVFYQGVDEQGKFVWEGPVPLTHELLLRGRERFDIYCSPCHGRSGDGQGMVAPPRYDGMVPPPSFHTDRVRQMPDGEIFSIISNGVRTMPSYRHQIVARDRWAVIAYVRALERSQHTTVSDVPVHIRPTLEVSP